MWAQAENKGLGVIKNTLLASDWSLKRAGKDLFRVTAAENELSSGIRSGRAAPSSKVSSTG